MQRKALSGRKPEKRIAARKTMMRTMEHYPIVRIYLKVWKYIN